MDPLVTSVWFQTERGYFLLQQIYLRALRLKKNIISWIRRYKTIRCGIWDSFYNALFLNSVISLINLFYNFLSYKLIQFARTRANLLLPNHFTRFYPGINENPIRFCRCLPIESSTRCSMHNCQSQRYGEFENGTSFKNTPCIVKNKLNIS